MPGKPACQTKRRPPQVLSDRDIGLVISSSSSEYWIENRALFVEGFRCTPSASFHRCCLPLESLQLRDRSLRTGIELLGVEGFVAGSA